MKKILISLFALSSVASFAMEKDFNVYTKLGIDVYSNYTKLVDDGITIFPKKGKTGYSLFLEATKNVTPNFEFGFGVGHIARKNSSHSFSTVDKDTGRIKATTSYKVPRYKSIPLYATAKYNFDLGSELKPYVKADLGYSFNKLYNSKLYTNTNVGVIVNIVPEGTRKIVRIVDIDKKDVKVKNGLYATIGAGVEYRNFLTELSYSFTKAKLKVTDEDGTYSYKYNNKAIRLSVGYKFNF